MGCRWTRLLIWLFEVRFYGTVDGLSLIWCGTTLGENSVFYIIYHGNKDIVVKWLNEMAIIAFRRVRVFCV